MNNRTIKAIVPAVIILIALLSAYAWHTGRLFPAPTEKITIGTNLIGMNGLLFVAKSQGFDRLHGLDLTIQPYGAGRDAARQVRAGGLEFACCAEFVLVNEIFTGADNLRCLATISTGDIHSLIARRDKGIARQEDLRGKSIGVPLGTSAEFYLARFLIFNRILRNQVTIVDVNLPELAQTLSRGKVDAVMAWAPATYDIMDKIGPAGVEWPAQKGQDFYWLLVSREDVIKHRKPGLEKLVRTLNQAADFVRQQPGEARAIMGQWTGEPLTELATGKYPVRHGLALEQGLLLAMEDQARWMIRSKLAHQGQVPNFLDYIQAEPLLKIDPKAVRLVLPGKTSLK
jgi:NitT/TauT family transport system substrate-binding protein